MLALIRRTLETANRNAAILCRVIRKWEVGVQSSPRKKPHMTHEYTLQNNWGRVIDIRRRQGYLVYTREFKLKSGSRDLDRASRNRTQDSCIPVT